MAKTSKLPGNFEAGLSELEQLVAEMESGKLPLDAALAGYQRGIELMRFCQGKLSDAEQQIRVLEAGELQPFAGGQGTDTAAAQE
ncbi:exodeoxyribonuclease VII small subunit [Chitinilyticum piscinae]|uniref:Exodeoxyribonuclease 7 small subunit n=1 Tax=Chitinilyticum piscinae TaxID=2866724 RepID=A0A8J7FJ47_9NEIS|nr:exodeoxyribonuclease VII small subunit [Chitinilyticum piscinae]MBE9608777.1 exodeoxyribonuclease VII small subunit [Chitinilyticum piscinae]